MANLPVESMKEGGLFWFTDLTLADPYFILPILTSVTMWITLEVSEWEKSKPRYYINTRSGIDYILTCKNILLIIGRC